MADGGGKLEDCDDLDDHLDDDLDDDLGAPPDAPAPTPRKTRTPRPRGGWPVGVPAWVHGPAAVVVLVIFAGLLGAAAGASHRGAVSREETLRQALTAGYAVLVGQQVTGTLLRADLRVAVSNRDDRALEVQLRGVSPGGLVVSDPAPGVRVGAGEAASVPLVVDVDCSAVGGAPGGTAASLVAAVRDDDDGGAPAVEVGLPLLPGTTDALRAQLAAACSGTPLLEPESGWLWQQDGALRVTVRAPALGPSLQLVVDASPGLGVTSEPSLPLSLAPGETAVVDLRVDPDCRAVGDGSQSYLDLQTRDPVGATTALGRGRGSGDQALGTTPWLARRIALDCG